MIEANGTLNKITTTTDGGWRVTLDFPGGVESGIVMTALATMRDTNLSIKIEEVKP